MANGPEQNATVEEILASIRQAISDDDSKRAPDRVRVDVRAPSVTSPVFEPYVEPSVQKAGSNGSTATVTEHSPDSIELAIEQALNGVRAELEEVVASTSSVAPEEPQVRARLDMEDAQKPLHAAPRLGGVIPPRRELPPLQPRRPLLSSKTDARVSASFDDLAKVMSDGDSRQLDAVVEGLLRPMLKDWLENNLPQMVERLVREEIERVSRGVRR